MNNKNKKLHGFALTPVLLAVAVSAVLGAGTVAYFHNIHHQSELKRDADAIVTNAEMSYHSQKTFTGATFNQGQAFAGTATIDASGKACIALQSELAPRGTVNCDASGKLTFTASKVKSSLSAGVADQLASLPSSDPAPAMTPKAVNLDGTPVNVGSSFASNSVANPPAIATSFNSVATMSNGFQSVSGGNNGSFFSSPNLNPGVVTQPVVSSTGTAVVTTINTSTQACGTFDNNINAGQGYNDDDGYPKIVTPSQNNLSCTRSSSFLYANEPSTPFQYGPLFNVYNIPNGSTISWNNSDCPPTIFTANGVNLSVCVPLKTTITSAAMNAGAQNVTSSASATVTFPDGKTENYSFNGNYTLHGPGYKLPTTPSVLSSMWGVNVVVSQGSGVDHYEMGITCGVNPPVSQFNATVQNVPASGLVSSVNTENLPGLTTGYYFVPVGVPYTVIASNPQIGNMTAALPQSVCNMNNGFGGVWVPQIQVRACNAGGVCSAWSPQFGQFCGFNRC
ncbi:MAG: hypothetical protein WC617_05150 [Rhodanobacter sp.]|jgi:predicted ribosomally synthesized peptide with SipW-like signal peptide